MNRELTVQTPTPTAYPTLDSQGRLNFVLNALKTNRRCTLPCWWGITPGKTTWKEMVDTFVKQGIGFYQDRFRTTQEQFGFLFLHSAA